jgi:hypothetical protein
MPSHVDASRHVLEKGHDRRGIQHTEFIGDERQSQNARDSRSGSFQKMADRSQGVESDLQEQYHQIGESGPREKDARDKKQGEKV